MFLYRKKTGGRYPLACINTLPLSRPIFIVVHMGNCLGGLLKKKTVASHREEPEGVETAEDGPNEVQGEESIQSTRSERMETPQPPTDGSAHHGTSNDNQGTSSTAAAAAIGVALGILEFGKVLMNSPRKYRLRCYKSGDGRNFGGSYRSNFWRRRLWWRRFLGRQWWRRRGFRRRRWWRRGRGLGTNIHCWLNVLFRVRRIYTTKDDLIELDNPKFHERSTLDIKQNSFLPSLFLDNLS